MEQSLFDELSDEQLEAILNQRRAAKMADSEAKRKQYENLQVETIDKTCYLALELQANIIDFKRKTFDEMDTLYVLLQEYSSRHKDGKGNFTVENDRFRVRYRHRVMMKFDERAEQAKKHILDFINTQWEGDEDTKEFVFNLLNRKDGQFDPRDIQKLYKMENKFDNENWRQGLKLLKESYQERDTKDYIQFEKKLSDGSFEPIVLNFATL